MGQEEDNGKGEKVEQKLEEEWKKVTGNERVTKKHCCHDDKTVHTFLVNRT